jgi:hypothetical protein
MYAFYYVPKIVSKLGKFKVSKPEQTNLRKLDEFFKILKPDIDEIKKTL